MAFLDTIICANILICERVLAEADPPIVSLIRMVDLFFVPSLSADVSPRGVAAVAQLSAVFNVKFNQEADKEEHTALLSLLRPNGETIDLGKQPFILQEPIPKEAPGGLTLVIKQLNVMARMEGVHYLIGRIDGTEVARAPFTLKLQSEAASLQK